MPSARADSAQHEDADASRPIKIPKLIHADSNSLTLPDMPSPACHVPSPHLLTVDTSSQVCTQLGSDSLSGIAPDRAFVCSSVHSSVPQSVQQMSPTAVGGRFSSVSSNTFACTSRHVIPVAPNSVYTLHASARPAPASLPAASASLGLRPLDLPSSASSLASASARPPGTLPAPVPASAALPVSALFVNSGPSKRRLLFEPGPKLAKRLKLG